MSQTIYQQSPSMAPPIDREPIKQGDGASTHSAQMILGVNGEIKHLTKDARHVLGYYPSQRVESNFFQLVHESQRRRVMWELAEMVGRHRQHATWFVRVKTGIGTWRGLRVQASNQLHKSGPSGIVLTLTPTSQISTLRQPQA